MVAVKWWQQNGGSRMVALNQEMRPEGAVAAAAAADNWLPRSTSIPWLGAVRTAPHLYCWLLHGSV